MTRAFVLLIGCTLAATARSAPTLVSINLCTDQLVLNLAAPEQVLSLSWLAADAEESMLAQQAGAYPPNYGTAEEVIRYSPDVVIAGRYSNPYTKALLSELGFRIVEVEPAMRVADIERNLLQVGEAIERRAAALSVIGEMRRRTARLAASGRRAPSAVVIRPGGFTIERNSLAGELLAIAGIRDAAADVGLDRWGSLSVETLLRARPQMLIVSDYKPDTASLANAWLGHPAVTALARQHTTVTLAAKYWSCGTPQSLDSLELLGNAVAAIQ